MTKAHISLALFQVCSTPRTPAIPYFLSFKHTVVVELNALIHMKVVNGSITGPTL